MLARRTAAASIVAVVAMSAAACSYSTDSALERGRFAEAPEPPPPPTTAAPVFTTDDPLDASTRIAIDSIGEVTWGMPVAEAMSVSGRLFVPTGPERQGCWVADPQEGPDGLTFLVNGGTVARVDVVGENQTLSGAGVGTTVGRLRNLFGGSLSDRTAPSGDGVWWILRSGASNHAGFRVVFETDGEVVTAMRAGRMPEVEWEGGCP